MSATTDIPAHASLDEALLAFQAEAPKLPRDGTNPHFKSKFTKLETIVEKVVPLLTKHGLVWKTKPSFDETSGEPTLKYKLAHAPSKESDEGEMKLLLGKSDPQSQGSAITYARRYALVSVLNLVADDDDDGNAASGGYGSRASKPAAKPTPKPPVAVWVQEIERLVRKEKVKTRELRALLRSVGAEVGDTQPPGPVVDALSQEQAEKLIEFLKTQPVPTGVSDVPADGGDAFKHPPADDPDIEPGARQFDVGPS